MKLEIYYLFLYKNGHNIFYLTLQKSIKRGPISNLNNDEHHNLIGALRVLLFLLTTVSVHRKQDLIDEICELLEKNKFLKIYPIVSYLETIKKDNST